MADWNDLRHQLTRRREAMGLTQRQVAARMGVVPSHVSDLERGRIPVPTFATLLRWASALGLDVVLRDRLGGDDA